jgi:hypothetical protein
MLQRIQTVSEQVQKLSERIDELSTKIKMKQYQRAYYEKKKAAALAKKPHGLKNLSAAFSMKDPRLPFAEWATVGLTFMRENHPPQHFIEWLVYIWNKKTYWSPQVTRHGGYYHVFINHAHGTTHANRLRMTEVDMWGKRTYTWTHVHHDIFCSAQFLWGFALVCLWPVVSLMAQDDAWIPNSHFAKLLGLMCGGYAEVELAGVFFDQCLPPHELRTVFPIAQPYLTCGIAAQKSGITAKAEPHAKVAQRALSAALEHS